MIIQLCICIIAALINFRLKSTISLVPAYSQNAKDKFINIITVIFILQSGLRNVAVGPDTYAYLLKFESIQNYPWNNIFSAFYDTYVYGIGKDPGYLVFMKLLSYLTSNYQVYLFIVAVIFFLSLRRMLKLICKNPFDVFIAVLVYQALYYGFFSVTGIRQTLAVAILFYGVKYVLNRNLIKFLAICLVAMTLHKSAVIFIPFYFVALYKKPQWLLLIVLLSLPVLFFVLRPFAQYLTSFSFTESYSMYSESHYETKGAQMFLVYMLCIAIMILAVKYRKNELSRQTLICLNAISIGLFFTPLTWVDPSLMRVVMYFSVFSVFALGGFIRDFCTEYKIAPSIALMVFFIIFSIVILKRSYDYGFFWQEMQLPENYNFEII